MLNGDEHIVALRRDAYVPVTATHHLRYHVRHARMTDWTTLLERVGIRLPQRAPVPEPAARILPIEQNASRVPREYRALYTYLEHRYASVVVLTFEQIEALLGFALPTPAKTTPGWWTDAAEPQPHRGAWTEAGRTAAPNFAAQTITFERRV